MVPTEYRVVLDEIIKTYVVGLTKVPATGDNKVILAELRILREQALDAVHQQIPAAWHVEAAWYVGFESCTRIRLHGGAPER